jgi:hypothetical protein
MGLTLKHLIDTVINGSSDATKNMVIHKMAESIMEHKDELALCRELYKEIHGNTLIPELCNELITTLHQGAEHGAKWSRSECESVANKLGYKMDVKPYTLDEFRAAMHVCYYMMNVPMKDSGITVEPTGWGRCANFYFTADDAFKDKLVGLYFAKVHHYDK